MRLLPGADEFVVKWASDKLKNDILPPYVAFGIVDNDGALCGAAIFNNCTGFSIELSAVGSGVWSRGVLRAMAHYAFVTNGVERVSARTRRDNVIVRKLLPKAGFKFEGTQRRYFGKSKGDDALMFALFKEDAEKWMRK